MHSGRQSSDPPFSDGSYGGDGYLDRDHVGDGDRDLFVKTFFFLWGPGTCYSCFLAQLFWKTLVPKSDLTRRGSWKGSVVDGSYAGG